MVKEIGPEDMKGVVDHQMQKVLDGNGPQDFVAQFYGPPGVGKSAGPRQLIEKYNNMDGVSAAMVDTRLSYHEPSDFSIPVKSDDGDIEFMAPKRFLEIGQNHDVVIWFLDEISHAKPPVQSVAFKMVLDRMIGKHEIPDNVVMVVAGNPQDQGGLYPMEEPLKDRFVRYDVTADVQQFLEYSKRNGLHPSVRAFIEWKQGEFLFSMENNNKPTTPRGWERVSDILQSDMDESAKWASIWGSVDKGPARVFKEFWELKGDVPEVDDVLENPEMILDFYDGERDKYYSVRSMVHEQCDPPTIANLVKDIGEAEIQMQFLKPVIRQITNAEEGDEYHQYASDNEFVSELIEISKSMTEEQKKVISEVLGQ